MCTVSIVRSWEGLRLVCNRDERRSRAAALAPQRHSIGKRTATFPVDRASGGTWIGVNDANLALVVLNRTVLPEQRSAPAVESRGTIIPALLAHEDLHGVVKHALSLDPVRFDLFRLIAIQGTTITVLTSDGRTLSHSVPASNTPLMFTSSSLGDWLVEPARRELFNLMVTDSSRGWLSGQQKFHSHSWPGAGAISVVMSRPDARTVSRTVIEMGPGSAALYYEALEERASSCSHFSRLSQAHSYLRT